MLFIHTGPNAALNITEAHSLSSTSLYLSWNPPPPEQHRGILSGYQFTYYAANKDPVLTVRTTTNTNITLEGLTAFTTYQVNVSPGTVAGYGPEDSVNITTRDDSKSIHEQYSIENGVLLYTAHVITILFVSVAIAF